MLFQAISPPSIDGCAKPPKPGGYRDSGADIAYNLRQSGVSVVTPAQNPSATDDAAWVWPDTESGIRAAVLGGASVLWANTTLFAEHPLVKLKSSGAFKMVGAQPEVVEAFDDKFSANRSFQAAGIRAVASAVLVGQEASSNNALVVPFTAECDGDVLRTRLEAAAGLVLPLVVKPVRGRGSEGVSVVRTPAALQTAVMGLLSAKLNGAPKYGDRVIVEEFLPGAEFTVTVMPPGDFTVKGETVKHAAHWALPVVKRVNHVNDIAPYNGIVAVTRNSRVLTPEEALSPLIDDAVRTCEHIGSFVGSRLPIRVDCRLSSSGKTAKAFDVNLKPNLTGAGRPGRDDQDSLTQLAAAAYGWTYKQLLQALLSRAW